MIYAHPSASCEVGKVFTSFCLEARPRTGISSVTQRAGGDKSLLAVETAAPGPDEGSSHRWCCCSGETNKTTSREAWRTEEEFTVRPFVFMLFNKSSKQKLKSLSTDWQSSLEFKSFFFFPASLWLILRQHTQLLCSYDRAVCGFSFLFSCLFTHISQSFPCWVLTPFYY